MFKLFLFLILLVVIYAFRRGLGQRENIRDESSRSERVETVLECACCGVLVPPSEGVRASGQFYCSLDHARLGQRNKL